MPALVRQILVGDMSVRVSALLLKDVPNNVSPTTTIYLEETVSMVESKKCNEDTKERDKRISADKMLGQIILSANREKIAEIGNKGTKQKQPYDKETTREDKT